MKIYFIRDGYRGRQAVKKFSYKGMGSYSILKIPDAWNVEGKIDWVVICGAPPKIDGIPPERIVYYKLEPNEFWFVRKYWEHPHINKEKSHFFDMDENHFRFAIWDINKSLDDLSYMNLTGMEKKDFNLSWITTNYGDGTQQQIEVTQDGKVTGFQSLEGHVLRMRFFKKMIEMHPDKKTWHLYGRRLEGYNAECNLGPLYDKWDGLENYRYSLAFHNSNQNGFYDEKFVDPVMALSMPILWGCPNLEKIMPKNSFIRVDLKKDVEDLVNEVVEISKSDFREANLDELIEARQRLLDKYSIMPSLERDLNGLL